MCDHGRVESLPRAAIQMEAPQVVHGVSAVHSAKEIQRSEMLYIAHARPPHMDASFVIKVAFIWSSWIGPRTLKHAAWKRGGGDLSDTGPRSFKADEKHHFFHW